MRKKIITTIVMIGMFLLVVANVSALTLQITPGSLTLNGEPNKKICSKLTIEYSFPNGLVEGRDTFGGSINISYPKSVTIPGDKGYEDVDVCVTAPEGLYHGALLYRTIQSGSVGIELNVWITVDTKPPHFEKDEPKEISAFSTVLIITTNENVDGNVIISEHDEIANPGKTLLGDLIDINAPNLEGKLKSVTIKKYYTIKQLNENSLDGDSLKLYYYSAGSWEELNSNVNKNAKYVNATVDHFSIFGIFGDSLEEPSKPVVVDDGDSTLSTTSLHAQWSSNSVGSDISEYMYAIGTSPESTNIVYWTSTTQTSVTETGLNLNVGTTYYFSVKAENDKGWSEVGVSDGIKIIKSGSKKSDGSGSSSSSSNSNNEESVYNTIEATGAEIIGGVINLGTSEGDENNKGGFLIIIPIILLILIALIVILSVKKSKKKVLSK